MATKAVHPYIYPPDTAVKVYPSTEVEPFRAHNRLPQGITPEDDGVIGDDCEVTITGDAGAYTMVGVVNEVQVITSTATAGQFKLTGPSAQTADIAESATGATIQTALIATADFDTGDVVVTGAAGGPWTFAFAGQYAGVNMAPLVIAAGTTPFSGGTITLETTVAGSPGTEGSLLWCGFTID